MKAEESYQFRAYRSAMTAADTIARLIDSERGAGNPVEFLESELLRQYHNATTAAVDYRENAAAYGVNLNRDETVNGG